jgi:hypothetical protein
VEAVIPVPPCLLIVGAVVFLAAFLGLLGWTVYIDNRQPPEN